MSNEITNDFPNLTDVVTDSHHMLTIVWERQLCNSFIMLVFDANIVEELSFVELDNIKHFLSLLQLPSHLQVLQSICIL